MKKSPKGLSPILKHTPYIGSARNKIIHSTQNPCQEVYKIIPDERWYISEIPNDGNFTKCTYCFPDRRVREEKLDEEAI